MLKRVFPACLAALALFSVVHLCPAQEQLSTYDVSMKRAKEAVEAKAWDEAAGFFGAAMRQKPGDKDAKDGFLNAIQNVEIYYTRFGDLKYKMLEKYGVTGAEDEMIQPALKWLAKVQDKNGQWHCKESHCTDDKEATAFALLAFLADGNSEVVGEYKEVVQKAVKWLLAQQQPNGGFGGIRLYSEGLVTLALVEAFAMGGTEETYMAAQKAINYLVKCQKPEGGWLYSGEENGIGDTSVTGMMFQPLMQGQRAYLDFDAKALDRGRKFVDMMTFDEGWINYRRPGDVGVHKAAHIALVPIGNLVRVYAGATFDDPQVKAGLKITVDNMNLAKQSMYFMYYGTMLTFLAGGESWTKWAEMMKTHLKATQVKEGDNVGCWEPQGTGVENGYANYLTPVEITAMATLSLQACYRYVPKKMVDEDANKPDANDKYNKDVELLARTILTDGWKVAQVPNATVKGSMQDTDRDFCDALDVSVGEQEQDGVKVQILNVRPVGKSSHMCNTSSQVSKVVEVPGGFQLEFLIANWGTDGQNDGISFRATDVDGGKTLFAMPIATGKKYPATDKRTLIFIADGPVKVRLVFDTTCRTGFSISAVTTAPLKLKAPDAQERPEIEALVSELGNDDIERRDAASARLSAKMAASPGCHDLIKTALCKSEDPEVRARIERIIAAANIVDLRTE
jgi:hypothetical protein